jgi:hypothetical protein
MSTRRPSVWARPRSHQRGVEPSCFLLTVFRGRKNTKSPRGRGKEKDYSPSAIMCSSRGWLYDEERRLMPWTMYPAQARAARGGGVGAVSTWGGCRAVCADSLAGQMVIVRSTRIFSSLPLWDKHTCVGVFRCPAGCHGSSNGGGGLKGEGRSYTLNPESYALNSPLLRRSSTR